MKELNDLREDNYIKENQIKKIKPPKKIFGFRRNLLIVSPLGGGNQKIEYGFIKKFQFLSF